MTLRELYDQTIRPLSASDRLRIAALILSEIADERGIDVSDTWDSTDLREFSLVGRSDQGS